MKRVITVLGIGLGALFGVYVFHGAALEQSGIATFQCQLSQRLAPSEEETELVDIANSGCGVYDQLGATGRGIVFGGSAGWLLAIILLDRDKMSDRLASIAILVLIIFIILGIRYHPFDQKIDIPELSQLFKSSKSLGAIAIGHAEGNLTATGTPTQLYYGHTDPGNFKPNQGWCSDQGRGGGIVERADQACLERVQQRLPLIYKDLQKAGINPKDNPEVFINIVDQYNQASPWVSRQFPEKYVSALSQGLTGQKALVWARVEAFRRNGSIDASGLIGICRRENRPVSDWDCVAHDQRRRVKAINRVLRTYSHQ